MLGLKIVFCAVLVAGANAAGCGFGYDGPLGPDHWADAYAQCSGKHQSPINIDSHKVNRTVLPPLKMEGFHSTEGNATLTNNGHTAMMTTDSKITPILSGGPLKGDYIFSQLHFHWGNADERGSEDEIDGKVYPMEMHLVFYKKDYKNATAAQDHSDGLCVIAVLFEVSDVHNHNFDGFTKALSQIVDAETEAPFEKAPALSNLLPRDLTHYFTYNGSLTTPPCSEVVTWIDFREPVKLSEDQFESFRALRNEEQHSLSNNFRAIQPLGDRLVFYNVHSYEQLIDDYVVKEQIAKAIDSVATNVKKVISNAKNNLLG